MRKQGGETWVQIWEFHAHTEPGTKVVPYDGPHSLTTVSKTEQRVASDKSGIYINTSFVCKYYTVIILYNSQSVESCYTHHKTEFFHHSRGLPRLSSFFGILSTYSLKCLQYLPLNSIICRICSSLNNNTTWNVWCLNSSIAKNLQAFHSVKNKFHSMSAENSNHRMSTVFTQKSHF